jgi:hypothetical protein
MMMWLLGIVITDSILTLVGLHVCSQVAGEGEFLLAQFASVRFVPGVQEQVIFQIRVFAESSVTNVTLERPRSVVHVHVRFQIARRRERLGAQCALVRFLLDVSHSVVVEIRTGREPFSADAALMWFFTAVDSPVSV